MLNMWNNNILKLLQISFLNWKGIYNTRVVKCHLSDLCIILACSWGWNNIFKSPSNYPSSFWSPQGMGTIMVGGAFKPNHFLWAFIYFQIDDEERCYLPMTIIQLHVFGKSLGLMWFQTIVFSSGLSWPNYVWWWCWVDGRQTHFSNLAFIKTKLQITLLRIWTLLFECMHIKFLI